MARADPSRPRLNSSLTGSTSLAQMVRQRLPRLPAWLGVTVVVVALASCGGDPQSGTVDKPRSGESARLEPDCPAPPSRANVSADLVNHVVSSADLPSWQAADIGASAKLSDGRLVWVFGDTVRAASLSPRIVANSMLISSGECVSQLLPPDKGAVIPDAASGAVYWPMSVTVLPDSGHDLIVVLCSRIRRGDGGAFEFAFTGSSAALFRIDAEGVPILLRVVEITPDNLDADQINWGAASTASGRWIYVYGTRLTGEKYVFGRELYVGRAPVDDPNNRARWEFWDGGAWQSRHESAAPVLPADGGVSQTLSVHAVDGRFIAVSKRGGDLADFVYTWSAPSAVGPWTARRAVPAPFEVRGDVLQYAPLAHPEIPLESGNLLVSISRNTTDLERLFAEPKLARPLFVEVQQP
jgi:hypothetical protein